MINKITTTAKDLMSKAVFQLQKNSPKIFLGFGIAGAVASIPLACRATIKARDVISDFRNTMNEIHECADKAEKLRSDKYTKDDLKRDTVTAYTQTGLKLVYLYLPSALLFTMSLISILASNSILNERNVALAAAYATLDTSFKKYRKNVVDRFGESVDQELRYGLQKTTFSVEETDPETGEEKTVKKESFVVNPCDISGYARFFEKLTVDDDGNVIPNEYWNEDNELNIMFLKQQERYANDLLRVRKRLFLNDVYRMLNLPATKAGQVVGWVYDPNDPSKQNHISFGLYLDNLNYSDFVNGFDPAILLDFNVDGNIWELMT